MAFRRALAVTPELIDYPIDLRGLYADQVTLDTHLAALARFVELHPDDPEGVFLLGFVYYASVQPEEAVSVLERLSAAHPTDEIAALVRDAARRVVDADRGGL